MDDKIIVTNLSALKAKYKSSGVSKIKTACKQLIAADKKRGLATRLLAIDDAIAMQKIGGSAVTNAKDPRQSKRALDAVFKKLRPDYLLILGSTDVIPHQDMKNPVFDPPDDPDQIAYGDLPYACEAAYNKKPEAFLGPTRVVGRLPDRTGDTDPAYLLGLLKTAATFKSLPITDYAGFFAISALVWQGSTRMSLDNLFGFNADLNLSPVKGPGWSAADLKNKLHFINCHGAPSSSQFFGQKAKSFPVSHDAALLKDKIVEGTVAAVECCYGGELYDSFMFGDGQMGIANAYLAGKAYGFFGSSTIAYGPPDANGAADLICQFFLKHVMEGASLGRAALEARQEFAQSSPNLDPVDLKTLAQFSLLGDPSVVPIKVSTPHLVATPKTTSKAAPKALADAMTIERGERRQQLHAKGLFLAKNQACAASEPIGKTSGSIETAMMKIAAKVNISSPKVLSFEIKNKQSDASNSLLAKSMSASAFHVIMNGGENAATEETTDDVLAPAVNAGVCVVAKEVNGNIVSYRELHRK